MVIYMGFVFSVVVAMSGETHGQETKDQPVVAAMVGDVPIFASEVQSTLQMSRQGQSMAKSQLAALQAQTLAKLVQHRLVTLRLAEIERGATESEIDAAIAQLQEQLTSKKQTIDDFLKKRAMTIEALRAEVAFRLGTAKFLGEELNDPALEAYFDKHRPRYDGRLLNVGHILMQIDGPNKAAATKAVRTQAAALRERIVAGELTFEQAAREYSVGPSRQENGQLGFIPRQGVMVDSFSRAAFELAQGEISPPVLTKFGIHLIRWTSAEPGDKAWTDVREQLQKALGNKLLNELAATQRETTKVSYTGTMPYAIPGTSRIVVPKASR